MDDIEFVVNDDDREPEKNDDLHENAHAEVSDDSASVGSFVDTSVDDKSNVSPAPEVPGGEDTGSDTNSDDIEITDVEIVDDGGRRC